MNTVSYGKFHRLSRLFGERERILIMAMDHGVPYGDVFGSEGIEGHLKKAVGLVDAVILNKGIVDTIDSTLLNRFELVFKLNGITSYSPDPYNLVMLSDVEQAMSYDPAALSYEMYLGTSHEHERLGELSSIIRMCSRFDVPLISHIYPNEEKKDPKIISHCIRLGLELGTDVIKTFYFEGMKEQLSRTARPVIIAGGPKMADQADVLDYISRAVKEDVAGIAMGRNLWGWGKGTPALVRKVSEIVHEQRRTRQA